MTRKGKTTIVKPGEQYRPGRHETGARDAPKSVGDKNVQTTHNATESSNLDSEIPLSDSVPKDHIHNTFKKILNL